MRQPPLVGDPQILLLDEPTSALDLRHALDMLATLRGLCRNEGLAAMVVLHGLNAAVCFADSIAMLHEGRLTACGPPAETLTAARIAQPSTSRRRLDAGRTDARP